MNKIEKIEVLRNTTISTGDVFAEQELLVPDQCSQRDADILISLGKARVADEHNPMTIIEAISLLDDADIENWTNEGKPQVAALESLMKTSVTAAQRDEAWAIHQQGQ